MTNPAYEVTNSDVEKLIAPYESKFSRLWERFDEACHGNAEHMRDILEATLNALEGAESDIAVLTSALEQAQQYSKKRDEENQDLMLTIGRLRVEREQMESAPNGMMQLSNELAEMKRIGKWVARSEHMPDPNDKRRICVYTPDVSEDLRYRFVPASLFKAVCSDATHWHYMEPPTEGGEWDGES